MLRPAAGSVEWREPSWYSPSRKLYLCCFFWGFFSSLKVSSQQGVSFPKLEQISVLNFLIFSFSRFCIGIHLNSFSHFFWITVIRLDSEALRGSRRLFIPYLRKGGLGMIEKCHDLRCRSAHIWSSLAKNLSDVLCQVMPHRDNSLSLSCVFLFFLP